MRLRWFEVQGYKNIEGRARLDEIGRFNVLHGDNNVGKSNLLESIGLLFVALRALREEAGSGPGLVESITRPALPIDWKIAYRSGKYFAQRGFAVEDIFHVATQEPIEITAHVVFDPADRAPHEAVEIAVSIERREDDATISLRRLKLLSGDDLAIGESKDAAALVLERLSPRPSGKIAEPRFLLIRADRTVISEPPVDDTAPLGARESLPPPLALALHDAELSRGPSRERFDRFLAAIEHARDLVGEGRWQMRYYPAEERADLVLERPRPGGADMIPLRLMGSGVQQLAAIAGELAMTRAAVVAIEEPELNLRWSAQHKLREMMRALVGGATGPAQLFVTSHAAAFEFEQQFYAITAGPKGPEVQRRPSSEAPRLLDPEVQRPADGARAPLSYVTSDGLVRVPDDVRAALGVMHGGGVTFVDDKEGRFSMLSDAQLWAMVEPPGGTRS